MKIDLHVHSNHSHDGLAKLSDIFKEAKKKGLDGIAITDHNNTRGWKEALENAKKNAMKIILGEEIKAKIAGQSVGEILGLFLNEYIKPNRHPLEIIDDIKAQGGLAIVCHPFDGHRAFIGIEQWIKRFDGVEVLNSRVCKKEANEYAMRLANEHKLAFTAGSDAHTVREVGSAYTFARTCEIEDFKKAIMKRKTRVFGSTSSVLVHIPSTLAKMRSMLK